MLIDIDAGSRAEAETVARDATEKVLGAHDVQRVSGADDTMQNRQMMLWILATRRQVRRWEIKLALNVKASLANERPDRREIWAAQIEWHLALVAANNLIRAIDNADGRFSEMPSGLARDVRNLRDLQEHWDEQWPAFYDRTAPGPLARSGKEFASRNPGASPYSFLRWSSRSGPELGPGLGVADVCSYLDLVEAEVLADSPDLQTFVGDLDPSPWVGDENPPDPWWPR